jgi:hypothetical protein
MAVGTPALEDQAAWRTAAVLNLLAHQWPIRFERYEAGAGERLGFRGFRGWVWLTVSRTV